MIPALSPASPPDWSDPTLVMSLLSRHHRLRRKTQIEDQYKLLYQGILGPRHLIPASDTLPSGAELKAGLETEFELLHPLLRSTLIRDPLVEPVHPLGSLLRLNLCPYKLRHGDLSRLSSAFLRTASRTWGSLADFQTVWGWYLDICRQKMPPGLGLQITLSFAQKIAALGFPPIHHSPAYTSAYRPSYRVVAAEYLDWIPPEDLRSNWGSIPGFSAP